MPTPARFPGATATTARARRPACLAAAVALLACAGPGAAAAAPPAGARATPGPNAERVARAREELQRRFTAADRDGDGRLSRAEAEAGMPRVASQFDRIDTAGSGTITLEQIEQALREVAAARRGGAAAR